MVNPCNASSARLILAIYPGQGDEPERAFQALKKIQRRGLSLLRRAGNLTGGGNNERFADLCFEGESLILARAEAGRVHSIVKQIRLTGSPAVFVLREETEFTPPSAGTHWKPQAGGAPILARLREHRALLEGSYNDLLEATRLDHALTAAAEWILDNAYLIRTQIAEVRRQIPRETPRFFPSAAPDSRLPRLYAIAHELVASCELSVNRDNIVAHQIGRAHV